MLPQTTISLCFASDLWLDGCGNVDHPGLSIYFAGKVGGGVPLTCGAVAGWLAAFALDPDKRTTPQGVPLLQDALHMVLAGLLGPEELTTELTCIRLHLVC